MKFKPEFFDIFGLFTFGFITALSLWLLAGNSMPGLARWILLIIGVGGLIIDGMIVWKTYIKK